MKTRIFLLLALSVIFAGLVYFAVVYPENFSRSATENITDPTADSDKQSETIPDKKTEEDNQGITVPETENNTEEIPETEVPETEVPETEVPKTEVPETTPGKKTVSFFAMGDNIVHDNVMRDASIRAGGTSNDYSKGFNFKPFYDSVAPYIKNADLAFVNQESLICADESKKPVGYPNFNSPRAMGDTLIELGFDIINTAHNHMLDCGANGLINSMDYWKSKNEITLIGGYTSEEDFNTIRYIEKNGIKIALLSYTQMVNNKSYKNKDNGVYIPFIDQDVVLRHVKEAKKNSDCVIVSMHWGTEDDYYENNYQRNLAQALVDAGVDVILGHHPHMLQTIKLKQRNDGGHTLICYSLGNSVSTMLYIKYMLGAFVTFDITKDGTNPAQIENIKAVPIFNYYDKDYRNIKLYLLSELTQDILDTHGSAINYGGNPIIENLNKRVNDHISSALLSEN